jgi:hypothetical protein
MKNLELGSELGNGMLFRFILLCGIVGEIIGPIGWAEEDPNYNALVNRLTRFSGIFRSLLESACCDSKRFNMRNHL